MKTFNIQFVFISCQCFHQISLTAICTDFKQKAISYAGG